MLVVISPVAGSELADQMFVRISELSKLFGRNWARARRNVSEKIEIDSNPCSDGSEWLHVELAQAKLALILKVHLESKICCSVDWSLQGNGQLVSKVK
jgi:hypothetical protein